MWTVLFFVLAVHLEVSVQVRLLVPKYVRSGGAASLVCQYDLDEGVQPYSVKWYRGQHEFFRFIPNSLPNKQAFPLAGIDVDITGSNAHQVTLLDVDKQISGPVSCEVSAEGTFRTSTAYANLTVIDVPNQRPVILVSTTTLKPGFPLEANCSIPKTTPPPNVNFYISAKKVDNHFIERYSPELSSVSISLPDSAWEIRSNVFFVRCEASLDGMYSLSSRTVPVFLALSSDVISSASKLTMSLSGAFIIVIVQFL